MNLFLDLETTGLPKPRNTSFNDIDSWPRIVQLAWATFDTNGRRILSKDYIIYPSGFVIPEDSIVIHRITMERAKTEGISIDKALKDLNSDLDKATTIISHNIDFDLPILNAEFTRSKIETTLLQKNTFCTMKSPDIVSFCKIPNPIAAGYKWPTLPELYYTLFNCSFQGHSAPADVEALVQCYYELKKLGII